MRILKLSLWPSVASVSWVGWVVLHFDCFGCFYTSIVIAQLYQLPLHLRFLWWCQTTEIYRCANMAWAEWKRSATGEPFATHADGKKNDDEDSEGSLIRDSGHAASQIEKSRILNDRRHCCSSQSGVFLPLLNWLILPFRHCHWLLTLTMGNRCEALKQMLLSLDRPPKGPFWHLTRKTSCSPRLISVSSLIETILLGT